MHTESAYDGCTAYCYPEQDMVDRLLRVHIQSQRAFGPWWTLSYNMIIIYCSKPQQNDAVTPTPLAHRSHTCMHALAFGHDRGGWGGGGGW